MPEQLRPESKDLGEASHLLAFPIGEGGPRQRRSGAFVNRRLETLLPVLFHTASALSAPSGHLPLEGKADDTRKPAIKKPSGIALFRHPERRETSYVR